MVNYGRRTRFYGRDSSRAVLCCCGFSSGKRLLPTSPSAWTTNEGCGRRRKTGRPRFLRYNDNPRPPRKTVFLSSFEPNFPATGRRAFASPGRPRRPGAAGAPGPRGALDSGARRAAAGGPPLQTQHHHLLHEAQVDADAAEARLQGPGGDAAAGGGPPRRPFVRGDL